MGASYGFATTNDRYAMRSVFSAPPEEPDWVELELLLELPHAASSNDVATTGATATNDRRDDPRNAGKLTLSSVDLSNALCIIHYVSTMP
jgi:hypothetical protein